MIIILYSLIIQILLLVIFSIILHSSTRLNFFVRISLIHLLSSFLTKSLLIVLALSNVVLFLNRDPVSIYYSDFYSLTFLGTFLVLLIFCAFYFRFIYHRVIHSPSLTIHGKINNNVQNLRQIIHNYLEQKNIKHKEIILGDFHYYVLQQDTESEIPFLCIQKNKPKFGYFNAYDIFFKASAPSVTQGDIEKLMILIYKQYPKILPFYVLGAVLFILGVILFSRFVVPIDYILGFLGLIVLTIFIIKKSKVDIFPDLIETQYLNHKHFDLFHVRKSSHKIDKGKIAG